MEQRAEGVLLLLAMMFDSDKSTVDKVKSQLNGVNQLAL